MKRWRTTGLPTDELVGPTELAGWFAADGREWIDRAGGAVRSGLRTLGRRRGEGMAASDPETDTNRIAYARAARKLARRARDGDLEAFAQLFAEHQPSVERICRRLLEDGASAEDAASDVFLRALQALESYDDRRPFGPWLNRLTSNYCIDQLRRRKTERRLFSDQDLTDATPDDEPDALRRITRREDRSRLVAALDALPDKYRLPLVLRFYQDLDYGAIAELLGVSKNQVGTLIFRAKQKLRVKLSEGGTP